MTKAIAVSISESCHDEGHDQIHQRNTPRPTELPWGQSSALIQANQFSEPLYRLGVLLARQSLNAFGERRPLKPGMSLEVDVVHYRRAIWEWQFEPLLASGARMKVLGG